jgi:hypothetical protein
VQRFLGWKRYIFADNGSAIGDGYYSTERNISVSMSGNIHLKPIFYSDDPIPVSIGYKENGQQLFGSVALEGEPIESISQSSAKFKQGDKVTLVAISNNGFRFKAWYTKNEDEEFIPVENAGARYTFTIVGGTYEYYAEFEVDDNAICVFDKGEGVKMMTWHSKRITLPTPTNFSVAQVDAEGYGEKGPRLTILKASSPDLPMKPKTYKIGNSNSRKLVVNGRGEKAYEFEVTSEMPVNKISVSTSTVGLFGGV